MIYEAEIWTFNAGGLAGCWRLMQHLDDCEFRQRPQLICIQEVAVRSEDWLALQAHATVIGYNSFATSNILEGHNTKGVLMLVKAGTPVRFEHQHYDNDGCFLALCERHPYFGMLCSAQCRLDLLSCLLAGSGFDPNWLDGQVLVDGRLE